MTYIATTLQGLEQVLAQELADIGAVVEQTLTRAVAFSGSEEVLYRANLHIRTALRILKPIERFEARNTEQLYRAARAIRWTDYMRLTHTFAISTMLNSAYFDHSQYAALRLKDGITDRFRAETGGKRPSVDTQKPDFHFFLHISDDQCTLLLDSSGDSLHKRGYRQHSVEAPLNEVLAAGMLKLAGWEGQCTFIDPMCGSGTLPIEAAMMARHVAPNLYRPRFGFENWREFDQSLLDRIRQEAVDTQIACPHRIVGSDLSSRAIHGARINAAKAGVGSVISWEVQAYENSQSHNGKEALLVLNPPYGERLPQEDIAGFYKMIGDGLKKNYSGSTAWILSGNKEGLKAVGLHTSRRISLLNGAIPCSFYQYRLYVGSKKQSAANDAMDV